VPVILAHCRTDNLPIAWREDMDCVLPIGPDWVHHLYAYVDVYVKKIRQSLMNIQEWDRTPPPTPPQSLPCHLPSIVGLPLCLACGSMHTLIYCCLKCHKSA
jgi:hypothetical protein